jgi:hypothetical protein
MDRSTSSNRFQRLFLSSYLQPPLLKPDTDPCLSTTDYNLYSRMRTEKYGSFGTRKGERLQPRSSDIEPESKRSRLLVSTTRTIWVTSWIRRSWKSQAVPCPERPSTIEMTEVCSTTSICERGRTNCNLSGIAIRLTLEFYQTHLNSISPPRTTSTHPSLVLLTDDRGNREQAVKAGFNALSTREYVDGMTDELTKVRLGDLVAVKYGPEGGDQSSRSAGSSKRKLYPEVSRPSRLAMKARVYNAFFAVSPASNATSRRQIWRFLPGILQR